MTFSNEATPNTKIEGKKKKKPSKTKPKNQYAFANIIKPFTTIKDPVKVSTQTIHHRNISSNKKKKPAQAQPKKLNQKIKTIKKYYSTT